MRKFSTKLNFCKICDFKCENVRQLTNHLSKNHNLKSKEYFDTFLATSGNNGFCKFCGGKTSYINVIEGYASECINRECRSKGAKERRKKLKNNSKKFKNFQEKVRKNQHDIWKYREAGEKEKIFEKIRNTTRQNIMLLTVEERRDRFGFLNKWPEEKREKWKENIMFKTGCFAYQQQKRDRMNVLKTRYEDIPSLKNYEKLVVYLSNKTYKKYIDEIDPKKLRGKEWHLDHRYSKLMGFQNHVPPEVLSCKENLQILSKRENLNKGFISSITLKELLEKYNEKIS